MAVRNDGGSTKGVVNSDIDATNKTHAASDLAITEDIFPDELARYEAHLADMEAGKVNPYPGLSEADITAWDLANGKLNEHIVIKDVDTDAVIKLRADEMAKQDAFLNGEKVTAEGGTVPKTGVGNTDISIENFTAKDVPTVKNGEFNEFFNSLSVDELDALWSKPEIRDVIEARLRSPGGLHEWHLVSRTPQFKYWDISAEQIKDLRTLTSEVEFVNPSGVHGGRGSTAAHNELLKIIDTSNDYDTFVRRLNNWANYRLKGGVEALPEGLQIK